MQRTITQAPDFALSRGLAEQIADYVQKQIVSGAFMPLSKISEASLTKELEVSRGPVRESLRVLTSRHLVELTPRKGARVTSFGPDDVNHLYDMQKSLMLLLIAKVFEVWKPDDLMIFQDLQKSIVQVAESGDALEFIDVSFQFQIKACEIVGNNYLTSAILDLQPSFSRAYYKAMTSSDEQFGSIILFIGELIQHIVDGDLTKCTNLVERYVEHQRSLVLDTFVEKSET